MIDGELLNSLQSSGIIDGYEYTLRRLIEANLPRENVYEKCAYFLLEYQKLILENNIRAKGLQDFIDLSEPPKKIEPAKPIKEIVPNFPITLKSKLLYEKENNTRSKSSQLVSLTIDELIKNQLKLSTKGISEQERRNPKAYTDSFAYFTEQENRKLKNGIMKTYPQYKPFEFIPILEIRKMNEEGKTNTNDNYNSNNNNVFTGSYNNNLSMGNLNVENPYNNPSRPSTENSQDIIKVSKDFVEGIINETKQSQGL